MTSKSEKDYNKKSFSQASRDFLEKNLVLTGVLILIGLVGTFLGPYTISTSAVATSDLKLNLNLTTTTVQTTTKQPPKNKVVILSTAGNARENIHRQPVIIDVSGRVDFNLTFDYGSVSF